MGTCPKCKLENFAYNDKDLCPDCFEDKDEEISIPKKLPSETFQRFKKKIIKEN